MKLPYFLLGILYFAVAFLPANVQITRTQYDRVEVYNGATKPWTGRSVYELVYFGGLDGLLGFVYFFAQFLSFTGLSGFELYQAWIAYIRRQRRLFRRFDEWAHD